MRDVSVRDAVQRKHLHNCKLQYLYNSTVQASVKCFHRMVVMAPMADNMAQNQHLNHEPQTAYNPLSSKEL